MYATDGLSRNVDNTTQQKCNTAHQELDLETKAINILNQLNSTKSVLEVARYLPDVDLPESMLLDLVVEILNTRL